MQSRHTGLHNCAIFLLTCLMLTFLTGVLPITMRRITRQRIVFLVFTQLNIPEQSFGYYWRARSNAAMDTAMETGIAVPFYEELIKVASKDTANANNRKWLIQAYSYVAAFKVNKEKMYTMHWHTMIKYFNWIRVMMTRKSIKGSLKK
jgi:hypothetical protein